MSVEAMNRGLFGRYLNRNSLFNFILLIIDTVLAVIMRRSEEGCTCLNPRKILLANGAHIGDVILTTATISVVKQAYPGVKVGVLVGRWSEAVVRGHPLVDVVHVVDHWRLNREDKKWWTLFVRYYQTRKNALREIKREKYDLSVDLYTCFPNSIPLLWQSGIPVRVGYVSSGFGRMLTCDMDFPDESKHEMHHQLHLLKAIGVSHQLIDDVAPTLWADFHSLEELYVLFDSIDKHRIQYVVIHPGAGAQSRKLPVPIWRKIIDHLARSEFQRVVLTGKGTAERAEIEKIIDGFDYCVNACDKLSWAGFMSTLSQAELFFGVDSMAGHAASSFGVPTVIAFSGIQDHLRWAPLGRHVKVVCYPVSCAPCHLINGCENMICINEISADMLLAAANDLTSVDSNSRASSPLL